MKFETPFVCPTFGVQYSQPISSLPADYDREKLRSSLSSVKTAQEFYDILPEPDKPLTLATILASGWMLKLYYNYADLLEQMNNKGSLSGTLEWSRKYIGRRNGLLQSSIGRALIMQMYWRGRKELDEENEAK